MSFFSKYCNAFVLFTTFARILVAGYGIDRRSFHASPLSINKHAAAAGPSFTVPGTDFTCSYPTMSGYEACNTADDRSCWLQQSSGNSTQYNINTDYEKLAPQGVIREYWLELELTPLAPNGYLKMLGQAFNGTFPGPHLQACWGDTVVVHVKNNVKQAGTTLHWHGIRQLGSNEMDGVNSVTQCPVAYGQSFTYTFNITQYGHTWYHSHYATQYADGAYGSMSIYGPSSAAWDEAENPIFISDWLHENSSVLFNQELTIGSPVTDGILFNGTNVYLCPDNDPRCCSACLCLPGAAPEFCCKPSPHCTVDGVKQIGGLSRKVFEQGKRYLFKLINSASDGGFIFMIDNHELEVIEADLVPITPFKTDSIFIGVGQRYQIVVTATPTSVSPDCQANSTACNYWVRTRVTIGCGSIAQNQETTGIISYDPTSLLLPTTTANNQDVTCADVPVESLQPIVQWDVDSLINSRSNYTFDSAFTSQAWHGAIRWDMTPEPMFLNYSNPTILNIDNDAFLDNNPSLAAVNYTFSGDSGDDDFVYLVVTGQPTKGLQIPSAAGHPMHLHGHDFVVLAQVDASWNGTIPPNQTKNPPRRDTAFLYAGGYLALAFKLDNPGVWVMHCHIIWHAASGLAMQIVERQNDILASIGPLNQTRETCASWDEYDLQYTQLDSGI